MARTQNPNIEILEAVVQALGPVCEDLVFLGGCATALLISDSAAPPVRATRDVDAIGTARKLTLPSGASIRLIDAAHFLATKLAAFDQRGDEDHVMSSDLEDVICVLDGRPDYPILSRGWKDWREP